jgi:zinc protease
MARARGVNRHSTGPGRSASVPAVTSASPPRAPLRPTPPRSARVGATVAGLALLASCAGQRPPPAALDQPPQLGLERYRLDNGLEVILHQDRRLPLVATSIWYHVGAIDERPGRSGFAHLFEHMMFQASPHVGEDQFFKILEQIGGTHINGTTDFDRTNYFQTVPSGELETVLWLEADRMGFLLSSVTEASLKNQIDVVQNERRQSVENAPYGLLEEKINQTLYPQPHPYHGNVIGSMDDIAAASLADVQDFFRTYYTPANATLTLAGDFDAAAAKALIQKYFGTLSGRPAPARAQVPAPRLTGETRLLFEEKVARLPKLTMVWMGPSAFHEDTAALDALAHLLSGTRSARLDKRLVHEDLIAQSVSASFQEYASGGPFTIEVVVRPGRTLEEAQRAVEEVLAGLATRAPTQEELDRARNALESATVGGLQQLGGFGGRTERLQTYNHYLGAPDRLAWDLGRYRALTPGDLSRVSSAYLGPDRVVAHATPVSAPAGEEGEEP